MEIGGKNLVLKETDWDDLPVIHALHSEPLVEQFNTIGIPGDLEVTKAMISGPIEDRKNKIRTQYEWMVKDANNGTSLGIVGLALDAQRFKSGEIHYSFFPEHWGNGYAFHAVSLVLRFAFDNLKLHRVHAGVAVHNLRSIKLLERIGMQREGRGREILPIRGEWVDNYRYAILENEF